MKYCPICDQNYPDNLDVCDVDGATLRFKSGKQDSLIGKVIKGRYRVIQKLGEGGMGTVYLAEQVAVSRKVALKWLHSDFARDEEFVRRFGQEAKLAAALNHRNVVTIFDFDQADDDSLYIVMEYVDGKNLADVLRQGPIEIGRALRMAVQIAEGLAAAHRAGVIHRDVKPENVMVVGQDEEIKLMDFGISRLRDSGGASRLTRSGTIMGTPAYMAPEQIEGGEVSERTDIYAFGIVLYEMLTGAVPFQAKTPGAILVKHLQETAAPLRKIRREVPALVERVVTQALEKVAERRQSSMQAVVDALKDAQRRAEVTKTSATRSVTEPLAKLGLSFGSAAARIKGIFGKSTSATSAPRQEVGEPTIQAASGQDATVLQQQKVSHVDHSTALSQPAAVARDEIEDKPDSPTASRFEPALQVDVALPPPAPEQKSGKLPVLAGAESGATVFETPTILQRDEPSIAPETVLVTRTSVEAIPAPPTELGGTEVLTAIEQEQRLDPALTREPAVEIEPVTDLRDSPTGALTVANTVIESASETIGEMTAPAVKREEGGGFGWRWIPVGAVAAALLAGVVYYQMRSDAPTQDVAVLETKPQEAVAEALKTDSSDAIEKSSINPATEPATVAETVPIQKLDLPAKAKKVDDIKTVPEKKSPAVETKAATKVPVSVAQVETKPQAKLEPEKPVKEPQTEVAALKPTKPAEPPVPPIAPEARLVSLAVLSEKKELDVNGRMRLTVKGRYSDGKENEIVGSIRWESSDGSVAAVNSRGELEARKEGKAQISASYSGLTSPSYTFFVKGIPQPEKAKSSEEGIQDLRRRLLR